MSQPGAVLRVIIQLSETQGVFVLWLTSIIFRHKAYNMLYHVTIAFSFNIDVHTLCGYALRSDLIV